MSYSNIPNELRLLKQWVVAGTNKIPLTPRTGKAADPTDPETWGTYEEAIRCGKAHIGFVLSRDDPYCAIDLDKPADEQQAERHQQILDTAGSYAEVSQSGNGVHIILRGKLPSGRRKDNVEVYPHERYIIMTGNVLNSLPIEENQWLLDVLYKEMATTPGGGDMPDREEIQSDADVLGMARRAENSAKFEQLWRGEWVGNPLWPSQSEADMALMAMLCYYSKNNEQCRRLFRESELGARAKAHRDKYLDYMISKCRAKEPPTITLNELKQRTVDTRTGVLPEGDNGGPVDLRSDGPMQGLAYPPGLIGRLADYFYSSAIRPVKEIGLAGALAYAAGVCGRSYNISHTGLNQYIILLAKTGRGKEGLASGIDSMVSALRPTIPMVDRFIGPASFASGQGLVRALDERPCFVSVLGEIGITLKNFSDPRANENTVLIKKMLLDLYNKSGHQKVFRGSVYSDSSKNTKMVQAPNVTILGESTPEKFYGGLDATQITDGLLPRFSIIEYKGFRPAANDNAFHPPPEDLVNEFGALVTMALTTHQNNTCHPISIDGDAKRVLDELEQYATAMINDSTAVEAELWNRAHMKALKLAGLLAVGMDMQNPIVTEELAAWARDFAVMDVNTLASKFAEGDVGEGQSKQEVELRASFDDYARLSNAQRLVYKTPEKLVGAKEIVPFNYLRRRLRHHTSFKNDRRGFSVALTSLLNEMVSDETLAVIDRAEARNTFGVSQTLYTRGANY